MKICVFSDIHGNGPAFWAAYDMILNEKADMHLYLGDICGYYFDQIEIYKALIVLPNLTCIRGNHDDIFLRIRNGDTLLAQAYEEKYGLSMKYLLQHETPDFVQWLSNLPNSYTFIEQNSYLCHGSPWNLLEGYVYPDTLLDEFSSYSEDLYFLGHTHYPMYRHIDNKKIVNPGSIGQPRNGGWPTYAVLELPSSEIIFRDIAYDKGALKKRVNAMGDNNMYLIDIIDRCQG